MKIIKNVSINTSVLDGRKNSFFTVPGKTFLPRNPYLLASLPNDDRPTYENK